MDNLQTDQSTKEPEMDSTPLTNIVEGEIVGEPTEADGQPEPAQPENPNETPLTETPEETPIIPETPTTEIPVESPPIALVEPASEPTPTEVILNIPESNGTQDESGMFTIRSDETGDKVYLVKGEKRYWVKNTETLTKLGFYLGKEKRLPFSELLAYAEGEPVDLTVPNAIEPWNKPEEEQKTKSDTPYQVWQ